jgi:hypothetical protein
MLDFAWGRAYLAPSHVVPRTCKGRWREVIDHACSPRPYGGTNRRREDAEG